MVVAAGDFGQLDVRAARLHLGEDARGVGIAVEFVPPAAIGNCRALFRPRWRMIAGAAEVPAGRRR